MVVINAMATAKNNEAMPAINPGGCHVDVPCLNSNQDLAEVKKTRNKATKLTYSTALAMAYTEHWSVS